MSQVVEEDPFYAVSERYIDTVEEFHDYIDEVVERGMLECCSVDTEADSMHSYETKLCLIQFSIPDELVIIDPLAIGREGMSRFPEFIDQFEELWMHGADYDISMFDMTFGWVPERILDTQIAARLLGETKFGLASLLDSEYGVKVSKQSQKADWSRRPLSEKMLAYAFNDVRYLLDLGDRFTERLRDAGRHEWFLESCDTARESVLDRDGKSEDQVWRISGWGKLSRRGLHFLRQLWKWRDHECRRLDRPAFKFVGNHEILRMARSLDETGEAEPPHFLKDRHVRRMNAVIEEAKLIPEEHYPSKRIQGSGPRLDIDETKFEKIRKFRNRVAEETGIEGTVIATRSVMERLAAGNLDEEDHSDGLMSWQRELLAPCLNDGS